MTSSEWLPQHAAFKEVRRGYSPEQVNDHLDRLEYDLRIVTADRDSANFRTSELGAQLRASQSEAEEFRRQLDRITQEPMSMSNLSERMQRMVRLAEDEASEIRARARTEVAEQHAVLDGRVAAVAAERQRFEQERDQARAQLAQQVRDQLAEATAEAEQLRGDAATQAGATLTAAALEADRLVTEARAFGEQHTAEARAFAEQHTTGARTAAEELTALTFAQTAQLTAETQAAADQLTGETRAQVEELLASSQAEATRLITEANDHHAATVAAARELDQASAAERAKLDAESDRRRAEVEEDFTIAIAARRTQAHQYIQQQELESKQEAEELVRDARENADRIVADATAEANRRVSYAAQESHRRVGEAEDAVNALLALRREVLSQLAGLQPYLGQVQQAVFTAGELLADTPAEPDRPARTDFDPQVEALDFNGSDTRQLEDRLTPPAVADADEPADEDDQDGADALAHSASR